MAEGMKSESLEEARARLAALSDAEREGMDAAQEGILVPERDPALDARADEVDEHGKALFDINHARGEIVPADEGAEGAAEPREGTRAAKRRQKRR
jgi:hypothetical protein